MARSLEQKPPVAAPAPTALPIDVSGGYAPPAPMAQPPVLVPPVSAGGSGAGVIGRGPGLRTRRPLAAPSAEPTMKPRDRYKPMLDGLKGAFDTKPPTAADGGGPALLGRPIAGDAGGPALLGRPAGAGGLRPPARMPRDVGPLAIGGLKRAIGGLY
jgi:hypothetical protein